MDQTNSRPYRYYVCFAVDGGLVQMTLMRTEPIRTLDDVQDVLRYIQRDHNPTALAVLSFSRFED